MAVRWGKVECGWVCRWVAGDSCRGCCSLGGSTDDFHLVCVAHICVEPDIARALLLLPLLDMFGVLLREPFDLALC